MISQGELILSRSGVWGERETKGIIFIPLKIRILWLSSHSKIKEENIIELFYQWDFHDSKTQES